MAAAPPRKKVKTLGAGPSPSSGFRGFVPYDAAVASGSAPKPKPLQDLAGVHINHLVLTDDQHQKLVEIYTSNKHYVSHFQPKDEKDQLSASSVLGGNNLDFDDLISLENKWKVRWSRSTGKDKKEIVRKLYQCSCGYNNQAAGTLKRVSPVDFTGCLAHVEIRYEVQTHRVLSIRGVLDHNEGCATSKFTRLPVWPVHPSVYEHALGLMKAGVGIDDVRAANQAMYEARAYPGMLTDSPKAATHFRWLLEVKDHRSLWRQYYRLRGVNVSQPAHINVDRWLDPDSPEYSKALADAIFHYSPRTTEDERFEICISTPEMKQAAWKYAHHSQAILDGTFGVCNRKMLLFIIMGVDESNRGVPLAFLLFSAPSRNRKTSAGYDTAILEKLLEEWRSSLGSRSDKEFEVWVVITDTDLTERGALLRVFPKVLLLICKFHLRQSWKNHLNKSVRGATSDHSDLKERLRRLEGTLIDTEKYDDAVAMVSAEKTTVLALQASASYDESAVNGALEHLDYLATYWLRDYLWESWARSGRLKAALLLRRPVNEILPTTNHLEAFNGILKNKHLRKWQHHGRQLRLDLLIHILVLHALPSIFKQRRLEDQEAARREALLQQLPGGADLIASQKRRVVSATPLAVVAYWVPDQLRDQGAAHLIQNKQISFSYFDMEHGVLTFECYSSLALEVESRSQTYTIKFSIDGSGQASCTCTDFQRRGGACKHMRAAMAYQAILRQDRPSLPPLVLPESADRAYVLRSRQHPLLSMSDTETNSPATHLDTINDAASTIDAIIRSSAYSEDSDVEEGGVQDAPVRRQSEPTNSPALTTTTPSISRATTLEPPSSNYNSDAQHSDTIPEEQRSPSPRYDCDFAELERRGRLALNEQTIARTLHDLQKVAPKLEQLADWLRDAHLSAGASEDLNRAKAVHRVMDSVTSQLGRIITEAELSPSQLELPHLETPSSSLQPTRRASSQITQRSAHHTIIPPSPEKKQRRHQSYNDN